MTARIYSLPRLIEAEALATRVLITLEAILQRVASRCGEQYRSNCSWFAVSGYTDRVMAELHYKRVSSGHINWNEEGEECRYEQLNCARNCSKLPCLEKLAISFNYLEMIYKYFYYIQNYISSNITTNNETS